jgi:hypothetical protein
VGEENDRDPLREQLREDMDAGEQHCIDVEYETDALGSRQRTAADEIFSAYLALWLARPTGLSFDVIVHAAHHSTEWVTRQIVPYNRALTLPQYMGDSFTEDDLGLAKKLFVILQSVSPRGPVHMAVQATKKALVEGSWEIRFLLFWIAVECLFGPEDGREISFRLSQRVALFTETDGAQARELFVKVKKSYAWRSKIVHGLRMAKLQGDESGVLLDELEQLVRRSLSAVLANTSVASTFDGEARENYLDSLAFE